MSQNNDSKEKTVSALKPGIDARRPYQVIFFIVPGICLYALGFSVMHCILINFVSGMPIYFIDWWGRS